MARVAVIGDVGGHRDELMRELERLGARDGALPADLTVVQVGDLVHRGPDSAGVVALVDHYLRTQPGQWRQVVGNHEAQYLREPAFEWPERIPPEAVATLEAWWAERLMTPAVAVRSRDGSGDERWLVTHGGLTAGYWERALGRPADAELAARALNSFAGRHDDVLFAAGQMLGGGAPDLASGPLWAAAATELVPSWLSTPLPFSQVHGHSMIVDFRRRQVRAGADVARHVTVDADAAHEIATLPGGRIVGVDPGHASRPHTPWRAFVLDDAEVIEPS